MSKWQTPRRATGVVRVLLVGLLAVAAACGSEAPSDTTNADAGGAADATEGDASAKLTACRATPGCACNGHPDLCDRPMNLVVFPAAHNAMSNSEEGWKFANHNFGLKKQLADGVRGFLLDTYNWQNEDDSSTTSWLCHGSCILGHIKLVDALQVFTDFLAKHPDEVLIFVVQDALPTADFVQAMTESGLLSYAMTLPESLKNGADLPSMRAVIKSGKRLLVTTEHTGGPPAWIHRFNAVGFDTPYSFKTMEALERDTGDQDSCRKFRGTAGASLFLVNHWVAKVLPTQTLSEQANMREVIVDRAQRCAKKHGRLPTLLAVDHYDVGDLFGAVRELNGL